MQKLHTILLKTVWWTGWPLLPVILAFLFTGYAVSGRFGLGRLLNEQTALTLHKLLHWPLVLLVLVHSLPAIYLALQRWGWTRKK